MNRLKSGQAQCCVLCEIMGTGISMVRILIAEEQQIVYEGIRRLIEDDTKISVIGIAKNNNDTIKLCKTLNPDVVLMNIIANDYDTIECIKQIKKETNEVKVLVLSALNNEKIISKVLNSGADGYVLNDISPEELIAAIKSTINGLITIHNKFFNVILSQYTSQEPNINDITLNENEKKIIEYLVLGRSNKEIASSMYLSDGRVRNIISEILCKLNLKNRTQIAMFAVKNHLF